MKSRYLAVIASAFGLTAALNAFAVYRSAEPAGVTFVADGPGGLKINGASKGVKLSEKDGNVVITAPTTAFETGLSLRDKHLKKYLESDKYPEATFVVPKAKIKAPEADGALDATAAGSFTLHGVTKPLEAKYHAVKKGKDLNVSADFSVELPRFGIEKPCYLGVCVGETVKVSVTFVAHDE